VWLWIVVAVIFLIFIGFLLGRLTYESYERTMRKDAIERSKSTILGNVYEKIVPIL
jgi:uncharacterized membrane-anchored protein YhcB (DUF1043 family)